MNLGNLLMSPNSIQASLEPISVWGINWLGRLNQKIGITILARSVGKICYQSSMENMHSKVYE